MIEVKNLAAFDADVERWFAAVEEAAEQAAVGLARVAFEYILENSPQYSGDFVANWNVSGGAPAYSFKADAVGGYDPDREGRNRMPPMFQMGSRPAIDYAMSTAKWPKIKLGQSVFLTNAAKHDEPYAMSIEHGMIKFRPENEGAERVVARAAEFVAFHYDNIGPSHLAGLRGFNIW